ncbi:CARDB domain-containing protein [Croceimicrobium hydrocarbonivorans]|uniref:CARDB domain-containing protein n=1 Tax=Croceimicrobium hydrocarbonivorans TaxID=2761580 RepID=A0A7H0VAR7_9FLAO|nr:CARDB domain-containing protein [Croceimicrobium hydrocarbonivorans]QNR22815.1 hypothetical protein H4K34_10525 [Croceimicrobium hydrocarbonivorans]
MVMIRCYSLLGVLIFYLNSFGQSILPPYVNNFDSSNASVGWSHYAITGTDVWELGTPNGLKLFKTLTPSGAWATNLDGVHPKSSIMALQTPAFNLSDTSKTYRIGLALQLYTNSYSNGLNIQYSVNYGPWTLLNGAGNEKTNWYNNQFSCSALAYDPAWSGNNSAYLFKLAFHSLESLKGHSNVRFRIRFGAGSGNNYEGVVMDYFTIEEDIPNLEIPYAGPLISEGLCDLEVRDNIVYAETNEGPKSFKLKYYLSSDSLYDSSDSLIFSQNRYFIESQNVSNFLSVAGLAPGQYYILTYIDADSSFSELREDDNIGAHKLTVLSSLEIPIVDNFDDLNSKWFAHHGQNWVFGTPELHQMSGSHSGQNAWSIYNGGNSNIIESPSFNPRKADSMLLAFWYMSDNAMHRFSNHLPVRYIQDCQGSGNYTSLGQLESSKNNTWEHVNFRFPESLDTSVEARLQINNLGFNLIIDDVYIGPPRPDLSIENKDFLHHGSAAPGVATLNYELNNSGLRWADSSTTKFYWSTDSLLDSGDLLLGSKTEASISDTSYVNAQFSFNKPSAQAGRYFIIYQLDADSVVNEMREYNNIGFIRFELVPIFSLPYFNDFETQIDGWTHNATLAQDNWQWGTPYGDRLNFAFSGNKALMAIDTSSDPIKRRAHLYSPAFDFSTLTDPAMAFDMIIDGDSVCSCSFAEMNMSYSLDGGATWQLLDTTNNSYNKWYYPQNYNASTGIDHIYGNPYSSSKLFDKEERAFAAINFYNSRDLARNTRYVVDLKFLAGNPDVRFRYNVAFEIYTFSGWQIPEGVVLDNFEIQDHYTDLVVENQKNLLLGRNQANVSFSMNVRNLGNFRATSTVSEYYLSVDSILDPSDLLLGTDTVSAIRPDLIRHRNLSFPSPTNLSSFNYLIYKLDVNNSLVESVENNNIGAWPLGMGGVTQYPYYEEFSASAISGWNYGSRKSGTTTPTAYRFRHKVVPGENAYWYDFQSNEFFTDVQQGSSESKAPFIYLYTPTFDFSGSDRIEISFDLMSTGINGGGNLQYSVDGGVTWSLVTAAMGVVKYNWYNNNSLSLLNSEAGWNGQATGYREADLDSTFFQTSAFKGMQQVQFRFQYRSNKYAYGLGSPQGMRLDNFKISSASADLEVDSSQVILNADLTKPLYLPFEIINIGELQSRPFKSRFYLSLDNVWDTSDIQIGVINHPSLYFGSTLRDSIIINHPSPLHQNEYYVFWLTDSDQNNFESNEENNFGSYKLVYPEYPNLSGNSKHDTIYCLPSLYRVHPYYFVKNASVEHAGPSALAFYWSIDSILSQSDIFLDSVNISSLNAGDSLSGQHLALAFPWPSPSRLSYILYEIDYLDQVYEKNEEDNVSVIALIVDSVNHIDENSLENVIRVNFRANALEINCNEGIPSGAFQLVVLNSSGAIIAQSKMALTEGDHKLELQSPLAAGIYIVQIFNEEYFYSEKLVKLN